MRESATQVLLARTDSADGFNRMFGVSLTMHLVAILLIVLLPQGWGQRGADEVPGMVMTISLGGVPGPDVGGMSPLGGRPVQQAIPLPPSPRPRAIRVPARAEPEMTVPTPTARRREVRDPPPIESSPEGARGQTLTQGDEARPGDALADTGVKGLGFGLSTGGGGGTGGYLDVGDFCCPDYLSTMIDLIRRNWNASQQVPGSVMMKFTIQRDGRLVDIEVEQSSGYVALDLAAQRALAVTMRLPPLPSAFTERTLAVHLNFQYQR